MRILIDECVDERLRNFFSAHECQTARFAGFAGLKNGDLLDAAESKRYDVLMTVDQGLEYQQNLVGRKIAVIVLRAKSTRLKDLLLHVPACLACLPSIRPGEIVRIPG
jgi:predicted nuclease of predicted toxin-antitoxin system